MEYKKQHFFTTSNAVHYLAGYLLMALKYHVLLACYGVLLQLSIFYGNLKYYL